MQEFPQRLGVFLLWQKIETHWPLEQVSLAGQRLSHPPQLSGSVRTSVHCSLQKFGLPAGHVLHIPSRQVPPLGQVLLHPPQFFGSVMKFVHCDPHEFGVSPWQCGTAVGDGLAVGVDVVVGVEVAVSVGVAVLVGVPLAVEVGVGVGVLVGVGVGVGVATGATPSQSSLTSWALHPLVPNVNAASPLNFFFLLGVQTTNKSQVAPVANSPGAQVVLTVSIENGGLGLAEIVRISAASVAEVLVTTVFRVDDWPTGTLPKLIGSGLNPSLGQPAFLANAGAAVVSASRTIVTIAVHFERFIVPPDGATLKARPPKTNEPAGYVIMSFLGRFNVYFKAYGR